MWKVIQTYEEFKIANKRLIGIFGGTFDPIHKGHVKVIENFLDLIDIDELIVLPNGNPPHKKKRINELNKIKLVNLALSHINNLIIDEREILKSSPSYAYLTLREIQKENPNDTLVWIMGMDSFLEIETWYEYENFLEEVNLLILERPGYEVDETSFIQNLLNVFECVGKSFDFLEKSGSR